MNAVLQMALMAAQLIVPPPAPNRTPPWCKLAGFAAIGLCLAIATGFGLTALVLVLTPLLGPAGTALAVAGAALVAAGLLGLLIRPWPASVASPAPAPAASVVAVVADVERLLRSNMTSSLLAALIAGAVAGAAGPRRP